ncbi:MAG: arginine repressor, partial [Candidatus Ornithomonoglobus sp.]
MKYKRQNKIIKIVKNTQVHTHDELIEMLRAEGFNVTQATVSRDIKELGLIKVPAQDGSSVYSVPEPSSEPSITRVEMVADSVKRVTAAYHTIVINTYPGMASAV